MLHMALANRLSTARKGKSCGDCVFKGFVACFCQQERLTFKFEKYHST